MLSFKPGFSLFSFTLIKRFFCSSSLSAIRMVSSAYLRLLIFLLAILNATCDSSSPAFHMIQETWVWSLGQVDPLEKATHSSILTRRIPWTEEPSRLQSMGLQRVGHDWVTNTLTFSHFAYKLNKQWQYIYSLIPFPILNQFIVPCLVLLLLLDLHTGFSGGR